MAAPAIFNAEPPFAHSDHLIGALVVTVALIVLSVPRGPVGERYGSWQRFIR